jgi:hypothetical protein
MMSGLRLPNFAARCPRCWRPLAPARDRLRAPGPLWRPRPLWRPPAPDLLAMGAGNQISSAGRKLRPTGARILSRGGDPCCCACTNKCFTEWRITYTCSTSAWGTWTSFGNKCLPADTSTARTFLSSSGGGSTTVCTFRRYVLQGDCCTADGDCATASAAPATPTDTPACCPSSCGCTNGLPRFASVNITGSACCTSCYAPPTELASAKVIGANFDGTWTLARQTNLCAYRAVVNAGTLFKLDCWDRDCSGTNGPIDEYPCVAIVLAKSSSTPNTWRLTFAPHDADALGNCVDSGSALGTFYFDSGFFIWNDADSCAGTATTTGNIFAACGFRDTGSDCDIPDNIGTGGTATIQLDF